MQKRSIFLFFLIFTLIVALPPPFPIKASPDTFGETSQGGNTNSIENKIGGTNFECPQSGTGDSITAWLTVTTAAHNVKCALYDTSGNLISNAVTEEKNVAVGADQQVTFNFGTPKPSLSNMVYIIVVWAQSTTGTCDLHSFSESSRWYQDTHTYNSFPNPASFAGPYHQRASIYCTYTPAVGEAEEDIQETFTLTDSTTIVRQRITKQSETLTITDATTVYRQRLVTNAETITLTDIYARTIQFLVALTETFTLTDILSYATETPVIAIEKMETINIKDGTTVHRQRTVFPSETFTMTDVLTTTIETLVQFLEFFESINLQDDITTTIQSIVEELTGEVMGTLAFVLALIALSLVLIKTKRKKEPEELGRGVSNEYM